MPGMLRISLRISFNVAAVFYDAFNAVFARYCLCVGVLGPSVPFKIRDREERAT
uniref:Uncharacterized protein n=1 Tax=Anguilla anguilla TaxID=7936 RepID=A0A0E9UU31_ANGAN